MKSAHLLRHPSRRHRPQRSCSARACRQGWCCLRPRPRTQRPAFPQAQRRRRHRRCLRAAHSHSHAYPRRRPTAGWHPHHQLHHHQGCETTPPWRLRSVCMRVGPVRARTMCVCSSGSGKVSQPPQPRTQCRRALLLSLDLRHHCVEASQPVHALRLRVDRQLQRVALRIHFAGLEAQEEAWRHVLTDVLHLRAGRRASGHSESESRTVDSMTLRRRRSQPAGTGATSQWRPQRSEARNRTIAAGTAAAGTAPALARTRTSSIMYTRGGFFGFSTSSALLYRRSVRSLHSTKYLRTRCARREDA